MSASLVGSEMCIRDSPHAAQLSADSSWAVSAAPACFSRIRQLHHPHFALTTGGGLVAAWDGCAAGCDAARPPGPSA
eukprot:4546802-Alexandrium_andersonii.AAC.1